MKHYNYFKDYKLYLFDSSDVMNTTALMGTTMIIKRVRCD